MTSPLTNACDCCGNGTTNAEDEYGEFICDSCLNNRAEAAYERFCSDFYGGEGPKTLREQQIEAWRLK